MKYELPKLKYEYNALEPYIDAMTMEIHYTKHHQAYITKLNEALTKHSELENENLENLLSNPDEPNAVKPWRYYNHTLFWEIMSPNPTKVPRGPLYKP